MRNNGISLIIIFHGRHEHLLLTLAGVMNGIALPNEIVLVEIDKQKSSVPTMSIPIKHVLISNYKEGNLPIAQARNLGAYWSNNEILAFLDVDCIPSKTYISSILSHKDLKNGIFMGYPRYLTVKVNTTAQNFLNKFSTDHPHRPRHDKIRRTEDYGMFWSLTFFLMHDTFSRIDGFDTNYEGYGAEDTDFALKAREIQIPFYITPHKVYHQQHPFCRPPLNHLKSIVNNSNYFFSKWGFWPMDNYLQDFADRNLISWNSEQRSPIKILSEPSKMVIESALVHSEAYA